MQEQGNKQPRNSHLAGLLDYQPLCGIPFFGYPVEVWPLLARRKSCRAWWVAVIVIRDNVLLKEIEVILFNPQQFPRYLPLC